MDQHQAGDDLRFVRAIVEGTDRQRTPSAVYFLWAVVGLAGFALVDFHEAWVPAYWTVAGPAGFVASAILGRRRARRAGQVSTAARRAYLLHWGGMMAAIFLAVLMPVGGILPRDAVGPAILLILALGHFAAGVHLDRAFLWIAVLMGMGYVFVVFVAAYAWTTVGVMLATALAIAALREERSHAAAALLASRITIHCQPDAPLIQVRVRTSPSRSAVARVSRPRGYWMAGK